MLTQHLEVNGVNGESTVQCLWRMMVVEAVTGEVVLELGQCEDYTFVSITCL